MPKNSKSKSFELKKTIRKIDMKRFCAIAVAALVSVATVANAYEEQVKSLSATLAKNIMHSDKKSIAVVDFSDLQGRVTDLGRFLAEELSVNLVSAGKGFQVVERTRLKTILEEHKLAQTGLIDPETAKKLGQIAGVDAIITGTVTPLMDVIRVSVKVLAVDTARIIAAASGDIPKTKAIQMAFFSVEEKSVPVSGTKTETVSVKEPPAQDKKYIDTNSVNGFDLILWQCYRKGSDIELLFNIWNNKQQRTVTLQGRAHVIFDEYGNEYKSSLIRIADKESDSFGVSKEIIVDTPIPMTILFKGISERVTKIKLLRIDTDSNAFGILEFRDIPVSGMKKAKR